MSLHHNWTNIRSAGGAGKVVLGPAGSGEAGEKVAIEFGGCGFSGMERVAAAGREGVIELAVIIGAGVPATAYDDTPGRLTATLGCWSQTGGQLLPQKAIQNCNQA